MKTTRASVEEYAKEHGLELYQIDGIPEGFSFIKFNERLIGDVYDHAQLVAFLPNVSWHYDRAMMYKPVIVAKDYTPAILEEELRLSIEGLLEIYKQNIKRRDNGK